MSDTETQQVETTPTSEPTPTQPVQVGSYTGQVKAFNPKKGYGFIEVHGESESDVFVHQTNIHPVRSTYRTLVRGEYVSFDISDDEKRQAINVRGVGGGTLRCDAVSQQRSRRSAGGDRNDGEGDGEFTVVRNTRGGGRGRHNRSRNTTGDRPLRVQNGDGEQPNSRPTLADYLPSDVPA